MSLSVSLTHSFDRFRLDMHFETRARRIGLLGASASGKSLTLRAIAGLFVPDQGRVEADRRVLFDREKGINVRPQERSAGYLFQTSALFPSMTVRDNIGAGLHVPKREKEALVGEVMERFGLAELSDRFPASLSGGQMQRVALARILVRKPRLLLLDEPFSALDAPLRDRMERGLEAALADYPGIAVMVSHNRDEIYRFSEEMVVIDDGCVVRQGPTEEVFADPRTRRAAELTGCKNYSRIRRIDAHHFEAVDYGCVMETEREIPERAAYLGIRAHDFVPVYGEREKNCVPCHICGEADLPFEHHFYLSLPVRACTSVSAPGRAEDVSAPGRAEDVSASGRAEDAAAPGRTEDGRTEDAAATGGQTELRTAGDGPVPSVISWFVQRRQMDEIHRRGMPEWLHFPEEAVLFLEK